MCEKDLQGVFGGYSGNIQETHSKSLRTQETLPNPREFWEPKGGKTFSIEPEAGVFPMGLVVRKLIGGLGWALWETVASIRKEKGEDQETKSQTSLLNTRDKH